MYGLYGLKHHTVEISGNVTRCRMDKRRRQTREDKATQPLDAGRLSFAMTKAQKFIDNIMPAFHARAILHLYSDFDTAGIRKKGIFTFHAICLIVVWLPTF